MHSAIVVFRVGDQRRGEGGRGGSILQEDNVYVSQRKTLKVLDGALNSFAGVFYKFN